MLTRKQELQRIVRDYRKEGEKWPASSAEIARWAVGTGRYDLARPTIEKHCARELAQAMRDEYFTDAEGRRVRAKHPARTYEGGQLEFVWDDIRTAPRNHMQMAFRLRRHRIASECKQVKTDIDSYNDAHPDAPPIQMPLDFTYDVEEMELAEAEAAMCPSSSELSPQAEQSPFAVPETVSLL